MSKRRTRQVKRSPKDWRLTTVVLGLLVVAGGFWYWSAYLSMRGWTPITNPGETRDMPFPPDVTLRLHPNGNVSVDSAGVPYNLVRGSRVRYQVEEFSFQWGKIRGVDLVIAIADNQIQFRFRDQRWYQRSDGEQSK